MTNISVLRTMHLEINAVILTEILRDGYTRS